MNKQQTYMVNRIEKILSEILTDKHECKVTLKFEKRGEEHGKE